MFSREQNAQPNSRFVKFQELTFGGNDFSVDFLMLSRWWTYWEDLFLSFRNEYNFHSLRVSMNESYVDNRFNQLFDDDGTWWI